MAGNKIIIPVTQPSGPTPPALVIPSPPPGELAAAFGYKNVGVISSGQVTDVSNITGLPIFMSLQLDPVTYLDDNGSKVSLNGMYIPIVIAHFHLHKNLKRTIPSGRRKRGGVNELTNPGAWDIKFEGSFLSGMEADGSGRVLDGGGNTFPKEAIKLFAQYCACTEAVGITHDLCKWLGIQFIAIDDIKIDPKPRFENQIFFEITGYEDIPLQLQINQDQTNQN